MPEKKSCIRVPQDARLAAFAFFALPRLVVACDRDLLVVAIGRISARTPAARCSRL
jgi:hypothetical protein